MECLDGLQRWSIFLIQHPISDMDNSVVIDPNQVAIIGRVMKAGQAKTVGDLRETSLVPVGYDMGSFK